MIVKIKRNDSKGREVEFHVWRDNRIKDPTLRVVGYRTTNEKFREFLDVTLPARELAEVIDTFCPEAINELRSSRTNEHC